MPTESDTAVTLDQGAYLDIHGKNCSITIEPRPSYCDRGNFIAKVFAGGELAIDMDKQDGWPRYYFRLENAMEECLDWLKKRRQHIGEEWKLKRI